MPNPPRRSKPASSNDSVHKDIDSERLAGDLAMKVQRTPDARFEGLPDYAFAPHYTEIRDEGGTPLRIHHIDEGPREAPPILLITATPPGLTSTGK
jgi:hypothetical protein